MSHHHRTTRLPDAVCPKCSSRIDAAMAASNPDAVPKHGDVTICAYCAAVLVFEGDPPKPALPGVALLYELLKDPGVQKARVIVLQAARQLGRDLK